MAITAKLSIELVDGDKRVREELLVSGKNMSLLRTMVLQSILLSYADTAKEVFDNPEWETVEAPVKAKEIPAKTKKASTKTKKLKTPPGETE